jgi:hypothetical protein
MNELATFWKWAYILGLGSYALIAIVVIPLGVRDLVRMFRLLRDSARDE